jgi:hypothetical protein
VYKSKESIAVIYSNSPDDSRGAQLLNLFGVQTWNAFDGLNSSPEKLCDFLVSQPNASVYTNLKLGLKCEGVEFTEILVE